MRRSSILVRLLLPLLAVGLPAILLLGAMRTVRKLEQQKEAYLRSRAAGVAARLETLQNPAGLPEVRAALAEEDPYVVGIDLFTYDDPASMAPAALREGRKLFHVERVRLGGEEVFRAWLPCHIDKQVFLARVELAEGAVAALTRPAQQNVWVASAGSLVVIALSLGLAWSARRTARAEQRQMELEHLARIGQMSAVLAHEIRNPLGTIKGFAQLLAERLDGRHSELLEPVISETIRLEQLVKDLLLYGRPPRVQLEPVDIPALCERIRGHAAQLIVNRPARFLVAASPIHLMSDPALLEQALLNLVWNAIEAVGERPEAEVRLAFATSSSHVTVTVTDNGPGLPAEIEQRLFEPFRTTKASGTGLGLAITRKLVTLLGGELRISNREEGGVAAAILLPPAIPNGRATDSGS